HPILQRYCANCHNEKYPGNFQLVRVRSKGEGTADALRANLDGVLRLINPENPAKSELLSSALVPHGGGPNPRPIFRGSNDPAYQLLAAWVNSLRIKTATDTTSEFPSPSGNEPFAASRPGRGMVPTSSIPVPVR